MSHETCCRCDDYSVRTKTFHYIALIMQRQRCKLNEKLSTKTESLRFDCTVLFFFFNIRCLYRGWFTLIHIDIMPLLMLSSLLHFILIAQQHIPAMQFIWWKTYTLTHRWNFYGFFSCLSRVFSTDLNINNLMQSNSTEEQYSRASPQKHRQPKHLKSLALNGFDTK